MTNTVEQSNLTTATPTITIASNPPLTVPNQTVGIATIDSSPPDTLPALVWRATVTLVGPTFHDQANYGVGRIEVGFQQTAHILKDRALDATTIVESSNEGKTYLDANATAQPWYTKNPTNFLGVTVPSFFTGGTNPTPIAANDSPSFNPIVYYESPHFRANRVQESEDFVLSVAAATLDSDSHLFQEAHVSWSVIADGKIDIKSDNSAARWFPSTEAKNGQQIAGVQPPTGGVWIVNNAPPTDIKGLLTDPPLANDTGSTRTWEYVGQ